MMSTVTFNAGCGVSPLAHYCLFLEHLLLLKLGSRQLGVDPNVFRENFKLREAKPCICSFPVVWVRTPGFHGNLV